MKRTLCNIILFMNLMTGIMISMSNYIRIYQDIKEPLMQCMIWSMMIFILYALILYSGSLVIIRLYYICKFRKMKMKYMNAMAFFHQILWLMATMFFLYGLCYVKSFYIGLIPVFLFFHKKLLTSGKFYIYHNERFILFDDKSREYVVRSINSLDNSMVVQDRKAIQSRNILMNRKLREKEVAFLEFCNKQLIDSKDVA